MEDLDLDLFIANIEQTAPEEAEAKPGPKCPECEVPLEDVDGTYTCPNCSAQATDILQTEETELHYDETGRVYLGDRVCLKDKTKSKHEIVYGWAWSTDEAIVHLLDLQIKALEKANLVPEFFRKGLSNMWLKFWTTNIAPFIRDSYDEGDLIPLEVDKSLKSRDVEVLVKVKDKVMIPTRVAQGQKSCPKSKSYRMLGTRFVRETSQQNPSSDIEMRDAQDDDVQAFIDSMDIDQQDISLTRLEDTVGQSNGSAKKPLTKSLGKDSITILTLNRTLAFIEATARCIKCRDPLFASDLIRACNCKLIPYFGAHKVLPDNIRLNSKDRLMFQKYRPISPLQLTRAASLLVHELYRDRIPFTTPIPSLSSILERFVRDLNLPYELTKHIRLQGGFRSIHQTKPTRFRQRKTKYFPQYDRWAFAVFICQFKKLFGLTEKNIERQARLAHKISKRTGQDVFVLHDWISQISIKLRLIMTYDPFMLYHPMVSNNELQMTPQLSKYIATLLSDRPRATTRSRSDFCEQDDVIRADLADFLDQVLPTPPGIEPMPGEELEINCDVRHPVTDAITRTKRYWLHKLQNQERVVDLLLRDLTCTNLIIPKDIQKWDLYVEGTSRNMKFEISPDWPYCFKLLLSLGGYVCYCEPRELLREVRIVEESLCTGRKRPKRPPPTAESAMD